MPNTNTGSGDENVPEELIKDIDAIGKKVLGEIGGAALENTVEPPNAGTTKDLLAELSGPGDDDPVPEGPVDNSLINDLWDSFRRENSGGGDTNKSGRSDLESPNNPHFGYLYPGAKEFTKMNGKPIVTVPYQPGLGEKLPGTPDHVNPDGNPVAAVNFQIPAGSPPPSKN